MAQAPSGNVFCTPLKQTEAEAQQQSYGNGRFLSENWLVQVGDSAPPLLWSVL